MADITVEVTLLSRFQPYAEKLENGRITVAYGTTAVELAVLLGIPEKFVVILLINGRQGAPGDELRDGDLIVYVPPAVGGG